MEGGGRREEGGGRREEEEEDPGPQPPQGILNDVCDFGYVLERQGLSPADVICTRTFFHQVVVRIEVAPAHREPAISQAVAQGACSDMKLTGCRVRRGDLELELQRA